MSVLTIAGGLQRCPDATAARSHPVASFSPAPEGQASFTVLIVDDGPFFHNLLSDVLQLRFPGLMLATAATVKDALSQTDAMRHDLSFMDDRLADGDGFEQIRRLRQRGVKAGVILITGVDFPAYCGDAMHCCADDYPGKSTVANRDRVGLVEAAVATRAAR